MSKVLLYSNNRINPFCTVKLEDGEYLLISVSLLPKPKIAIYKCNALGLMSRPIWTFTREMAGDNDSFIRKFRRAFVNVNNITKHPLDMIKDIVMDCRSSIEVMKRLFEAELKMYAVPQD